MKSKKTIAEMVTDPIVMKNVIDTILDPKNPDLSKIRKEIIKNITNCIQKDDAFLTTIKGIVIDKAESITNDIVTNCLNESREQLTNALVSTINMECEQYFNEQKRVIMNVLKKTLDNCVKDIMKSAKQTVEKNTKALEKKKTVPTQDQQINVPAKYKDQVEKYVKFLMFQ